MEYAILLVFCAAIAVGVVSAVVRTWSLHARLYSLEDRVNVLEGVTTREVKIRAAAERWKRPNKDEERIEAALAAPVPQAPALPWWQTVNAPRSYNG